MSTATEITRLQDARNAIRNKMVEFGLGSQSDKLDVLASEVNAIENRGAISATIDGLTNTSVVVLPGYTSGGTVSLTYDIEQALAVI